MAKKNIPTDKEYIALKQALKTGNVSGLYAFYYEEKYLMRYYLQELRKLVDADGMGGFNYHRFEGNSLNMDAFAAAIEALPVFADRTMVEVYDCDIFKADENTKRTLYSILSDLPDYVCVVFVFDAIEYPWDKSAGSRKSKSSSGKKPADAEERKVNLLEPIRKYGHEVAFLRASQTELTKWISAHYKALGKKITKEDAEYLSFLTDGYMTAISKEIEKTAVYAKDEIVTRSDIDALVEPAAVAQVFNLTNAVADGDFKKAAVLLDKLFQLNEAPHALIYNVSREMRRIYMARLCIDNNRDYAEFKGIVGINADYQAKILMQSARKISTEIARQSVIACAETAFCMNSGAAPDGSMIMLLSRLADIRQCR